MANIDHIARMYMVSLEKFTKRGPTNVQINPLSLSTLYTIHNRIHQMWCNHSGNTPDHPSVHCTAIDSIVPVEIFAERGLVFVNESSITDLCSITPNIQTHRDSGVEWVYVPLALYWKSPPSHSNIQTMAYYLCMLVINNHTMEYDLFDPNPCDLHVVDTFQTNNELVVQMHSILQSIQSQKLFWDYKRTLPHRKLEERLQTPIRCVALVFFVMAFCRRYQVGNPWDVADCVIRYSYVRPLMNLLNTDPLTNWLQWVYKCRSWMEVAMCVGLLRKGSHNQPQCGVITDQNTYQQCTEGVCNQSHKYQHAYCKKHRFELILHEWVSRPTFDLTRYLSSDIWSMKTDPLPIGINDGEVVDVDTQTDLILLPFGPRKRNRTSSTDTYRV